MIITLVTDDYIVQASDRRVTYGSRVGEVMNKAVIIDRSGCAAYTGLAFLDGKMPTDEFLMEAIDSAATEGEDPFQRLARHASRAVHLNKRLPNGEAERKEIARTSFVIAEFVRGAGPCDARPTAPSAPVLTVVSNAQADLSESWAPQARKKFQSVHATVQPGEWILHVAGQAIPGVLRRRLDRDVSRAIARCAGPEPAARLLARAIQTVSETNKYVGPSVNCVMIRNIESDPYYDASGQRIEIGPAFDVPLGEYGQREANYFVGPRSDKRPEPVQSVFLPHPDHPEVAHGPSFVLRGMMRGHSPIVAREEISDVAVKAVQDLRAGRTVDLSLPKQFRRPREPRILP